MALYRLQFLDHADLIYLMQEIECDHDEQAIEAALQVNIPTIGTGFEVWGSCIGTGIEPARIVRLSKSPAVASERCSSLLVVLLRE